MTWFQQEFHKEVQKYVRTLPDITPAQRIRRFLADKICFSFADIAERLAIQLARRAMLEKAVNSMAYYGDNEFENVIKTVNDKDYK